MVETFRLEVVSVSAANAAWIVPTDVCLYSAYPFCPSPSLSPFLAALLAVFVGPSL